MTRHHTAALLGLGLIWAGYICHVSGVDMQLSRLVYAHYSGFPRDHVFLKTIMHDGIRRVVTGVFILLVLTAVWDAFSPRPWLKAYRHPLRVFLVCAGVFIGGVAALKSVTTPACPWDMAAFGGIRHVTAYADIFRTQTLGNGRCFPAGHSTSGYVWLGLPFVFGRRGKSLARAVLCLLPIGMIFSAVQILRGAHFLSHELTTLGIALVLFSALPPLFSRRFFAPHIKEFFDVF